MAKVAPPAPAGLNGSEKICLVLLATTLVWALSGSKAPDKTSSSRDLLWQVTVTGNVGAPRQRLLVHWDLPYDRVTVSDDQGQFEVRESLRSPRSPSTCLVSLCPPQGACPVLGRGVFEVVGVECRCNLGRLLLPGPPLPPPPVTPSARPGARAAQPISVELDEKALNILRSEPGTNP
jgi:hypothetical protein